MIAEFDFETYSEAGYIWNAKAKKWGGHSPTNKGISAVGAAVYSEHPTTEVLSLAYDLRDGLGPRVWVPGLPEPLDLFEHIKRGGLIEAFNSAFEFFIWANVCEARMGWPALPYLQLRDAKAKAMAHNLPGNLKGAAEAIGGADKIKDGKRLINLFSVPRTPTKKDPRQRVHPMDADQGEDAVKLYEYNIGDIIAERGVSERVPDLSAEELKLWLLDQKINLGGVSIDIDSVNNCIAIVDQAVAKYERDIPSITGGQVEKASQASAIRDWVNGHGYSMPDCTADSVDAMLERDLPEPIRRVLWTRSMLGSASVKKLYALKRQTCRDGRLRDIFAYYGAATGRWAGRGPQPQNLPNSGPRVVKCDCCQSYFSREASAKLSACLHGCPGTHSPAEWGVEAVESTLAKASYGDLEKFEQYYSDPIAAIGGCLRGLFIASEGRDFICSNYSAIEAVCLAAEAGEEWRLEVFRTHGLIYEMSAAKITGVPFEDFIKHKAETGDHHPLRKKVGKVAELASGYQGGLNAWLQFGADEHLEDWEIKEAVQAWRKESPAITAFWYGLQDAAHAAVMSPGQCFSYRRISYGVKDDVLYCQLPSGRKLAYHKPRLTPETLPWGKEVMKLSYMGNNSDYKRGPKGWLRIDTYGGRLVENVVQAVARDILAHALVNLDAAGYDVVLHVHDEIVAEVDAGAGSVEQFEQIMAIMPHWASHYPIKAAGGWRGKRYRKD